VPAVSARRLAQRLVADGETVLDVPAKLSTRVRAMSTGHGRKTDPTDARAVAIVGLCNPSLTHVAVDDETVTLRLLSERRRDLVRSRTQAISRLHQVLVDPIPSGAPRNLTASKAKQLLATVRPRDVAAKARRQLGADYIDDVAALDRKLKTGPTRQQRVQAVILRWLSALLERMAEMVRKERIKEVKTKAEWRCRLGNAESGADSAVSPCFAGSLYPKMTGVNIVISRRANGT
jgi:hypothetical protein